MEVRKTVLVGHSAERMFDLIEAAEHYPDFLPWCAAATIVERDSTVVAADVTVDYHGVRFHFRTRNPKRPPEWMAIRLEHGPFHRFEGEWKLTPLGADGCRIDFLLRYDFKRGITGKLAAPVFDRIADTLVDAFVTRADRVFLAPAVTVLPPASAMSPPGRPKGELLPLGGTARSAKGADMTPPGRPKGELLPLGGTARSAKGADVTPSGRPAGEYRSAQHEAAPGIPPPSMPAPAQGTDPLNAAAPAALGGSPNRSETP